MKRRDFCKLTAAGTAALVTCGPLWAIKQAWATGYHKLPGDDWINWFCQNAPPNPARYSVCDAHFHFYDFVAHTDGIQALIQVMNQNKVEHIMFSGMPLVKKWDQAAHQTPVYYLDNNGRTYWYSATDMLLARTVLKIQKAQPDQAYRFHPFICGFNATDMYAVEHVQRMLDEYPGLWHGVGEAFGHRDDLTNMTYGETARADHPALMKIYDLAAKNDLPVTLHNNVSSRGKAGELLYLSEVENAVAKNPKTRLTWAHAGLSRYFEAVDQPSYTAKLKALLNKYDNLHIDLSWLVLEEYIIPDPRTGPLSCWIDLISAHPTRFMIGTDSIGHFDDPDIQCATPPPTPQGYKYAFNMRKYWVLLDSLSKDTAQRVARDNFLSILPKRVREKL